MVLKPLRDIDVRVPLRTMVRRDFPNDSIFLEEMVVPEHDTRIDLAVVNGSLHGFEIKSDADTLRRLPSQRDSYNALFDQVSLIVGARHIKTALPLIPEWWGVAMAVRTKHSVGIEWERVPTQNPNPDPTTAVKLLCRTEIEKVIRETGLCSATSKYYVYELTGMLMANLSPDLLRSVVRSVLKQRHGFDRLRTSCDG